MNYLIGRARNAALETRARLLRWINGALGSVFAAVSAAYATYPDSVQAFLKSIPERLIFPAAILFVLFVHAALKHPKDGKDAS